MRVPDSLHILPQSSKKVNALQVITFAEQSVHLLDYLDSLAIGQ